MSLQEGQQSLALSTDPGAFLLGENVQLKAHNSYAGCTIYNNITEQRPDLYNNEDTNLYPSISPRKPTVEVAKMLADAIAEDDTGVLKTIFKGMTSKEIIESLQCELQADYKSNAIRYACTQLNYSSVEMLLSSLSFLEKKGVIGHKGHDGLSAFHVAVERGNTDLVMKLLELQLADPEDPIPVSTQRNKMQDTKTKPGDTALDIAAMTGDTEILQVMRNYLRTGNQQIAIEAAADPEMEILVREPARQDENQIVQYAPQPIHPLAEKLIGKLTNAVSKLQDHISRPPYSNLLSDVVQVAEIISKKLESDDDVD